MIMIAVLSLTISVLLSVVKYQLEYFVYVPFVSVKHPPAATDPYDFSVDNGCV